MTAKPISPSLPAFALLLTLAFAGGGCATYQIAAPDGTPRNLSAMPAGLSIGELMQMLQAGRLPKCGRCLQRRRGDRGRQTRTEVVRDAFHEFGMAPDQSVRLAVGSSGDHGIHRGVHRTT